jgi:hypothetical protein
MSSNRLLTDYTLQELEEKKKKYKFMVKLIDEEISKKNGKKKSSKKSTKKDIKKTSDEDKPIHKNEKVKIKSTIKPTIKDIKYILTNKNIDFKANMNKEELWDIVKKNNLVRIVEDHHKNKVDK